ncbi:MAG: hypothetical protein EOR81_25825 [Mesorhizobium sp.]|nr:MAG: hypothetical protein EOR81_25825 [Mesorhizobium sp.]
MRVNRLQQVAIQIAFLGLLFTVLGFNLTAATLSPPAQPATARSVSHRPESSFQTSSSPLARSAA